jgi:hypothetical protein
MYKYRWHFPSLPYAHSYSSKNTCTSKDIHLNSTPGLGKTTRATHLSRDTHHVRPHLHTKAIHHLTSPQPATTTTTMSTTPTIAFFGATGDCAGYCLAACLRTKYTCTALARSSQKLQASLSGKGISPERSNPNFLTITQSEHPRHRSCENRLAPQHHKLLQQHHHHKRIQQQEQDKAVDPIISGTGPPQPSTSTPTL